MVQPIAQPSMCRPAPPASAQFYRRIGKRAFDLVGGLAALVVFFPIILLAATGVRITLGRPVFFRQLRPGRDEIPFMLFKLRTMRELRDARGDPLPDSARLTPLGRWLRRSSIDELPELWNVVRGHMSLVGPRPLLMQYGPHYTSYERRRFAARPGITGLAQTGGRNELGWDDRLALDVAYVEQCSFILDVQILFKTMWQVVHGKSVHPDPRSLTRDFDVERMERNRRSSTGLRTDA